MGAIVLGCGRSGTSAVTRSLVMSGFFAGTPSELLGPSTTNPTGHYEPLQILELNEQLLRNRGSAWWAEAPEMAGRTPNDVAASVRAVVIDLIERAEGAPIVIKEPRINGLLDVWGPVADEFLHPVLVIRHPIEVAFSLARRDGNSFAHAAAAWEVQTNAALRWANGRLVTLAHYDRLARTQDAAIEISREVAAHLEPNRAERVEPNRAVEGLDPRHRHERAEHVDSTEYLTARQRDLWEFLAALAPGRQRLEVPKALLGKPVAAMGLIEAEGDRIRLFRENQELVAQTAQLSKRIVETNREREEASRDVEVAQGHQEQLAEEVNRLHRDLDDVRRSVSWRVTRPLRSVRPRADRGR